MTSTGQIGPLFEVCDPLAALIGTRIREARTAMGLALDDLAASAQVSHELLVAVENGRQRVDAEQLWDISQCLCQPISYFFSDLAGRGNPGIDS